MYTKLTKWLTIAALGLGLLWGSAVPMRIGVGLVVFAAALTVAAQAMRTGKHFWWVAFVALAVLLNPVASPALSHQHFLVLDGAGIALFLASLHFLKWQPIFSMPSITYRTPGSESL